MRRRYGGGRARGILQAGRCARDGLLAQRLRPQGGNRGGSMYRAEREYHPFPNHDVSSQYEDHHPELTSDTRSDWTST